MIKPEQIPDEVIEEARKAWLASDDGAVNDWRKAIAAAINAWATKEHRAVMGEARDEVGLWYPAIFLPLPREKSND